MIRSNPSLLQPLLAQIGQSNPQLLQLISSNPGAFINLLRQDLAEGGSPGAAAALPTEDGVEDLPVADPSTQYVEMTQEEREAIDRVCDLSSMSSLRLTLVYSFNNLDLIGLGPLRRTLRATRTSS